MAEQPKLSEQNQNCEADMVTMWTVQTGRVLQTLEDAGEYYVKSAYVREKYGKTAWIFLEAYRFFTEQAEKRIPKPEKAQSPVWMFRNPMWAVPTEGAYRIKLRIPKKELLTFDLRIWSKILNLSYVGTEGEEKAFDSELKRQGISCPADVFQNPYYPVLKAKIKRSWEQLFDTPCPENYLQGACWMLKKEWITDIENSR